MADDEGLEGRQSPKDRHSSPAHVTGVGLDYWGDAFPSTHWSIVLDDPGENSATQRMLERLCTRYWYPLYAYLRKRGYSTHDAQDYTQGFFSKMLEADGLAKVDRNRGRFRSYMIGAMNHFLSDERQKTKALKRGGGRALISIDEELAEERFKNEPADTLTPEILFDREWALALLKDVYERLETEYAKLGKGEIFEVLGEFLTVKPEKGTYPKLALRLGVSPGNVRVMVTRIRSRYQSVLRETIGETVSSPEEIESELGHLLSSFSAV